MPVDTVHGHMKSTEDNRLIGELLQQGYNTDEVDVNFVESGFQSIEEQAVQVIC